MFPQPRPSRQSPRSARVPAADLPVLPYRKPTKGRDYWVLDDVLPDVDAVRRRCLAKDEDDWVKGYPHTAETWPGLRTMPGLEPGELARVEGLVKKATGAKELWVQQAPGGGTLNHNCIQVVGEGESEPRPHTDSRALCRYAAVLYLNPDVPKGCGTGFYRQSLPGGRLGGNVVQAPHTNLVEALGTRFVAPDAFEEDVNVPHRYNRLLLYHANLVHSATGYTGRTLAEKRMTAVFFWMA
ncbi:MULTISPECIES: DUF6445 family protein [unclassified Streptomyces]|uniref:DUF6445 family protein n=1 Tax=unclassified Streptomyces TaxID=2593676 RepID=UPI001F044E87|nr:MULTISPECIES: DUF6445 family protein [unclassified Streptomyces]MCH0563040.1 hypothetical protein [Streptomyces sp. MUM 2J]MCH0573286.1 hypothetical protein [Streptomyces sp. MUM 136J]